jgi:hypothetical protein
LYLGSSTAGDLDRQHYRLWKLVQDISTVE